MNMNISIERLGRVVLIRLNRPRARNALSHWTSPMKDRTPFPPYDKG